MTPIDRKTSGRAANKLQLHIRCLTCGVTLDVNNVGFITEKEFTSISEFKLKSIMNERLLFNLCDCENENKGYKLIDGLTSYSRVIKGDKK